MQTPNSSNPAGRPPIRVLVADDSAFMRQAISRILSTDPALKVIDTARDGKDALEKAKTLKPDVITLDIEMPNVDGLAALRAIRRECSPVPAVLMCSSLTTAGSMAALQAMRFGAADVIAKDASMVSSHMDDMRDELIAKIKAIAPVPTAQPSTPASPSRIASAAVAESAANFRLRPDHRFKPGDFELILIGSSTGGPPVLETILSSLPANLPCPVVVAQHMPLLFTKSIALRLNESCPAQVCHAESGTPLLPGHVYICPGGTHAHIARGVGNKLLLTTNDEPRSELYKPSVNVLFSSTASNFNGKVLGIVLTGMGEDGGIGSLPLKAKGATIITQEAKSCVVYGMPRAVVAAGTSDCAATPEQIGAMLASLGAARAAA